MKSRQSNCFEAIIEGKQEVVKQLLEEGIDVNSHDNEGRTFLYAAVAVNSEDIVKILLRYGARVDIKDIYDVSPLELSKRNKENSENHGSDKMWKKLMAENREFREVFKKQNSIYDLLVEASQKQKQADKAQKIIGSANLNSKDTIAITLAKIFKSYAHPPLFSFNWHHGENQKISDEIAGKLKQNPEWSWDQCKNLIDGRINPIKNRVVPLGTFAGLLIEIEKYNPELPQTQSLTI